MKKLEIKQLESLIGADNYSDYCNAKYYSSQSQKACIAELRRSGGKINVSDLVLTSVCTTLGIIELGLLVGKVTAPFGLGILLIMGGAGCIGYGITSIATMVSGTQL